MMKHFSIFVILVVVRLIFWGVSQNISQAQEPPLSLSTPFYKVAPSLQRSLTSTNEQMVSIIIDMVDQADLSLARRQTQLLDKRTMMVNALQTQAVHSQEGVLQILAQAETQNKASEIRPLWIINAVTAKVHRELIPILAQREEVALVREDGIITLDPPADLTLSHVLTETAWGVSHIGANTVWQTLGIDGTGVVVASIDSGVDYLHPDLHRRYRGYLGPNLPAQHAGNWFDATGLNAQYPLDANFHGTHTLGLVVGQNGIGVAPGATWIALRIFDNAGQAQNSWIHRAFEWLLAPNGDPSLAPQVVNNSWSNPNGSLTEFTEDIRRLWDAGIIPVFSAGNYGPQFGTVASPASNPNVFSVGAFDAENRVANLSGRGPSVWGEKKPEMTAPGVNVLSTLPGGGYGRKNGTSMAAPHVVGTIALLLQVDPRLTYTQVRQIITSTATPLGDAPFPNNIYGWGGLNAYAAVQQVAQAGQVVGFLRDQSTQLPIGQGTITLQKRGFEDETPLRISVNSNAQGAYALSLKEGVYDVSASAFGYFPHELTAINLTVNEVVTRSFDLEPRPTGTIAGRVIAVETGQPLSATIEVNDTPLVVLTDPNNAQFSLNLPPDTYDLTIKAWGHRVLVLRDIQVQVGQTNIQNVSLSPVATMLLVDGGAWYDDSQIVYYQQALDALGYTYHTHHLRNRSTDVPTADLFAQYDIVLWSAPADSPGYVGAEKAITDFLDQGGHLFLSGHDVAFFENSLTSDYYGQYLKIGFDDETTIDTLSGVAGDIFEGLRVTISGGDGAKNQIQPDVLRTLNPEFATSALVYTNHRTTAEHSGIQRVGDCLPYRAIVLGFGLEGVSREQERLDILDRSLTWFQSPRPAVGLSAAPTVDTKLGKAGDVVTHTFVLKNEGEVGQADTFHLSIDRQNWPVDLPDRSITLNPCEKVRLELRVTIPPNVPRGTKDIVQITAQSSLSPSLKSLITRTTKVRSFILLVDDDRWYDFEADYAHSFAMNELEHDQWTVQSPTWQRQGKPSLDLLQYYPFVVWFTAFDWHEPLTSDEEVMLKQYLDAGGRLAFLSQEYLFKLPSSKVSDFARTYFGIADYSEVYRTTLTTGVDNSLVGQALGPYAVTFPKGYQNWTDSVSPTNTATPAFINQAGRPNALTNQGGLTNTWHTAFFGFGIELLEEQARDKVLGRTMGWLSWLGQSTLRAPTTPVYPDDTIDYVTTLYNDGPEDIESVSLRGQFPPYLTVIPNRLTGNTMLQDGEIVWTGPIGQGEKRVITYQVTIDPAAPYAVSSQHTVLIDYTPHEITVERLAFVPLNIPQWQQTTLAASSHILTLTQKVTYTLNLINTAPVDVPALTITTHIPSHLSLVEEETGNLGDIMVNPIGQVAFANNKLTWFTPLSRNQVITLGYTAEVRQIPYPFTFPVTFQVQDGYTTTNWTAEVYVEPRRIYLPLAFKS